MITREAMMVSWTMIRIDGGIILRMTLTARFEKIITTMTASDITKDVSILVFTANAEQMIKDLTLEYNKVRQAAITSELLEITTAMKAME